MGPSLPLADFTIRFEGETGESIAFAPAAEDNPAQLRLWQIAAGPDYALSLALSAPGPWRPRLFLGAPRSGFAETECLMTWCSAADPAWKFKRAALRCRC